jgi:hypothetical protein
VAVGVYFAEQAEKYKPLFETWNGRSWSIMNAPNPEDTGRAGFTGIACPSEDSCFASGYYETDDGNRAVIERWNGTQWSIVPVPVPSGSHFSGLGAVSCPTRTACYAVGGGMTHGSSYALVEYWNGNTWKIQTSAAAAHFSGVSCSSTKNCFVVGYRMKHSVARPLVLRLHLGKWSITGTPKPPDESPNTKSRSLSDVSCLSATNCFAVGGYSIRYGEQALIEHWNGHGWKLQPSPSMPQWQWHLSQISCAGPTAPRCFAVDWTLQTRVAHYS